LIFSNSSGSKPNFFAVSRVGKWVSVDECMNIKIGDRRKNKKKPQNPSLPVK
jgi:hypothetical protein